MSRRVRINADESEFNRRGAAIFYSGFIGVLNSWAV